MIRCISLDAPARSFTSSAADAIVYFEEGRWRVFTTRNCTISCHGSACVEVEAGPDVALVLRAAGDTLLHTEGGSDATIDASDAAEVFVHGVRSARPSVQCLARVTVLLADGRVLRARRARPP